MTPPASIDWDAVHRQIDAGRQMTERGWAPSAEEQRRILRARSDALAVPLATPAAAEETLAVVTFLLAGETYAIELSFVREVQPLTSFTPLPGTPGFVLGIVNVRGQIISLIDLRHFFDLPKVGLSELNKLLILQGDDMELGILADAMLGVQAIPRDDIQSGLPMLNGIRQAYLKGVTAERLVVLDGGKLLSDRRLVVNEQVGA